MRGINEQWKRRMSEEFRETKMFAKKVEGTRSDRDKIC